MQTETAQHFFGAGEHALMLVLRLLGRGDRDELDLGELVLPDHAARILASGARLRPETRRAGGVTHRQRCFVEDGFTDEIGQRNFGSGDETEPMERPSSQDVFGARGCWSLGLKSAKR